MVANWLVRLSRLSKVVGSNYILPTALQLGHERDIDSCLSLILQKTGLNQFVAHKTKSFKNLLGHSFLISKFVLFSIICG